MDNATDLLKRALKATPKAMEEKIKGLRTERKGKLAQFTHKRKEIKILMTEKNNAAWTLWLKWAFF